ncbi:hypothetical protein [Aquitalea sp. LB_tupeE]|uniref:hypothetical protein n=1 Tax=Aquitalea sp. LB_tupeE TaxID=2748078 RepID=UPI0015BF8172|nr:hypothetical protein [Aquitalea sp. LB_tupeE]NWK76810.1 hypothetical protein [Aquitalea sp. LB_tupeE]
MAGSAEAFSVIGMYSQGRPVPLQSFVTQVRGKDFFIVEQDQGFGQTISPLAAAQAVKAEQKSC